MGVGGARGLGGETSHAAFARFEGFGVRALRCANGVVVALCVE